MGKYIWITVGMLVFIGALAWKQAPAKPVAENVGAEVASEDANTAEPLASESGLIEVSSPVLGVKAASPILVKGKANTPANTIKIRLTGSEGGVLAEKSVVYEKKDGVEFGEFNDLLIFEKGNAKEAVLEIFSAEKDGGLKEDLVTLPIIFE